MSRHLLNSKSSAPVKSKPAQVATWAAAPSCRAMPTAASSTPDAEGRLWGWNQNTKKPCAYKDPKNHVLFYVDYAPGVGGCGNVCKQEIAIVVGSHT